MSERPVHYAAHHRRKARPFRLRPLEPSESDIQRAIRQYLAADPRVGKIIRYNRGVLVIEKDPTDRKSKRRWVHFNDARGHSDLGGYLKGGRAYYMEVKKPDEDPTEDQQEFLNDALKSGAVAGVVRSVDDAKRLIDEAFAGNRKRRIERAES